MRGHLCAAPLKPCSVPTGPLLPRPVWVLGTQGLCPSVPWSLFHFLTSQGVVLKIIHCNLPSWVSRSRFSESSKIGQEHCKALELKSGL